MKKFLLIVAIITFIALTIGVVSFIFSDANELIDVLNRPQKGNNEDIEYYPIFNFIEESTDLLETRIENFFYNMEYILERLF